MKKRWMLLIATIVMSSFIMTGCAQATSNTGDQEEEKLTIVTSFYPIYLHTINIAKDIPGVEVLNMTQPQTGCLHDYQLSPDDIRTLDGADIFIINGGGMESFMDKVLSQLPKMPIINASENIALLEEHHPGHTEDDAHDHDFNPHVWVGVSGAIEQVEAIAKELTSLDPDHKSLYEQNAKDYVAKLELLKGDMHTALDHLPNRNIVTFHEAFPYFAEEFNLTIVGTIVDEPGNEPSAKELTSIIEKIKEHNVKGVFIEPQFTSKAADLIAKEAGLVVYTLDPVVTGETTENEANAYIKTMRENLKTLEEALR